MPSGGSRPGAGRPRGSTSSKRLRTEIATIQRDISSRRFKTALEFAMSVINDPNADMNDKIRLAIAAMPFQHPKLAERPAGKKILPWLRPSGPAPAAMPPRPCHSK
jgi:hypothetical protein